MAHAFDGQHFEQLLRDAKRLVARALDHEHRLASLVKLLECNGNVALTGERPPCVPVVDDSPDNRDLTARVLEDAAFLAITASNGLEGVIVAHYARPALC